MAILGRGPAVPYERCVLAATGRRPEPSRPAEKRRRLAELLARAGHPAKTNDELLAAVDAWRRERMVPAKSIATLANAFIARFDAQTTKNLAPHLPEDLRGVPRSNMTFVPIRDAWFSGFMNYVGRARNPDGSPQYEATYEINASLQISVPEFEQLVGHEVVPGHVTTSALIQGLYVRGRVGFESTILAMNTRWGTLAEGIGNNAVLIALGLTEVEQVPDEDLQVGLWLAHLAGRRQERGVVPDLAGRGPSGRRGRDAAARVSRFRGTRRKVRRGMGAPSALRTHESSGLPRGDRGRRGAAAPLSREEGPPRALRLRRPRGRRYAAAGGRRDAVLRAKRIGI